jgi:hypothetical protein
MNKIIWSFWQENPSLASESDKNLLADCLASWKKNCPGWTIRILNYSNYTDWVPSELLPKNFSDLTFTFQSDIIRLVLLYKYGGLWVDATYEFLENIKWLEDLILSTTTSINHNTDCYGFFNNKDFPENHFLYCSAPGSVSVNAWLATVVGMAAYSPDFSKSPVYETPGVLPKITVPNYFMSYAAYMHCAHNADKLGFVGFKELPTEVYVFYISDVLLPHIPGTNRNSMFSKSNLLGNDIKLIKYGHNCRYYLKNNDYIFSAWMLIFLVGAALGYYLWKPSSALFLLFLVAMLITSGVVCVLLFRLFFQFNK